LHSNLWQHRSQAQIVNIPKACILYSKLHRDSSLYYR
jgi:hypothetical protein